VISLSAEKRGWVTSGLKEKNNLESSRGEETEQRQRVERSREKQRVEE